MTQSRLINTLFLQNSTLRKSINRASAVGAICIATLMASCSKSDDPSPVVDSPKKTSILIYAVASNNLSPDFTNDMNEVLEAARSIDFSKVDVWVYSLTRKEAPKLTRLVKNSDSGDFMFEIVKDYDRLTYSTDPVRISEVISDYKLLSDAEQRGLIFWSHATGWTPNFSDHIVPEQTRAYPSTSSTKTTSGVSIDGFVTEDLKGWYGQDIIQDSDGNDHYDYCDLLELDIAVPAGTFDFIWFDCCYMSAIEVLYQLRDKTPYIVAYPTEMAAEGLPYQIALPYLASENIDLAAAAEATANYFLNKNSVITICVTDTSHLDELAENASKAVKGTRPDTSGLQKYSRTPSGPFYDFGQYTSEWGSTLGEEWNEDMFRHSLDKVVIYKAASSVGFDHRPINPETFSGISCHYFRDNGSDKNEYYKSLDWFKAVYSDFEE